MRRIFPAWTVSSTKAATILCLGLIFSAGYAETSPPFVTPGAVKEQGRTTEGVSDLESMRTELQQKLADAKSLRDRASTALPTQGSDTFLDPEDQGQYQRLIETLVYLYQVQLETLPEIQDAVNALAAAESREQSWTRFDKPPPYSILMVDDLQEAAETAQGKLAAYEASLGQMDREISRLEKEAEEDKAAERRAAEAVDKAGSPEQKARARGQFNLAQIRDRVSDNRLAWAALDTRLTKLRLAAARAESALLDRQVEAADRHTVFSEKDRAEVKSKLELQQQKLEQEQQTAESEHDRWVRERDRAQRALKEAESAKNHGPGETPESARIDLLHARLRAADTWLQTSRFRSYALQTSITLFKHLLDLWDQRDILLNSTDPEARRKALTEIKRVYEGLQPLESYLYSELDLIRADELKQTAKIDQLVGGSQEVREFELSILNAYRAKREEVERVQILFHRTRQSLQRWLRDYGAELKHRTLGEKLEETFAEAAELGRTLWRFELFTVEDRVEIDGKPVTVSRGVTFGKSIGAIFLLFFGYWFSAAIARRMQHLLQRRYTIDPPQANVFRRWILAGCMLLVLVWVLNFANIPLTVFAFLGGALAIGVGFGTQTLLKNLISGVLVLAEHKIKVGDIVEVDGVVGTVTEVDIRSSTVRGFDGVETMVPNATFLENKVTNWTYTTLRVRRTVKIGVAYGSPVRRVADILADCANRHGLILSDPAPYVWFEDFGDNALQFGLYYWLELLPHVSSLQVASDLRFMVEKRFGDEGIVIAFPQRDVHLLPGQPLQVAVVSPNPAVRSEVEASSPGKRRVAK